MQEQLIELKSDSRLKHLFTTSPLSSFWVAMMPEYPQLCDIALKIILLFASTYLCEAGFSRLTALKTKYRNLAQIEDDLRICLSNIAQRFEESRLMSNIDRPARFFFFLRSQEAHNNNSILMIAIITLIIMIIIIM